MYKQEHKLLKVYIPISLINVLRKLRRDVSLWDFVATRKVCFLIAGNFEQSHPVRSIVRVGARVATFFHLGRSSASRSRESRRACTRVCRSRARLYSREAARRDQGRTNEWMDEGPRRKGNV